MLGRIVVGLCCGASVVTGLLGALGFLGLDEVGRVLAAGAAVAGVLFWQGFRDAE